MMQGGLVQAAAGVSTVDRARSRVREPAGRDPRQRRVCRVPGHRQAGRGEALSVQLFAQLKPAMQGLAHQSETETSPAKTCRHMLEFCHFADALSPSLLIHLMEVAVDESSVILLTPSLHRY